MSKLGSWFKRNFWYMVFFVIGLLAAMPYSIRHISEALEIVGVLMLVALFASLLVPFAAFSRNERVNKNFLMYAPLVAFGAYATVVGKDPSVIKAMLLVAVMGMHLSYWTSGIHSRNFRFQMFKDGYGAAMPKTMQMLSYLCITGRSEVADRFIHDFISGQDFNKLNAGCAMECVAPVVKGMADELRRLVAGGGVPFQE